MPRSTCRDCGADGPLFGNGRQYCASCMVARRQLSPCANCRRVVNGKVRVRAPEGERLYCQVCAPAAKAAAAMRNPVGKGRPAKKKAPPVRCVSAEGSFTGHYWLLPGTGSGAIWTEPSRCQRCGATKMFPAPSQTPMRWDERPFIVHEPKVA